MTGSDSGAVCKGYSSRLSPTAGAVAWSLPPGGQQGHTGVRETLSRTAARKPWREGGAIRTATQYST